MTLRRYERYKDSAVDWLGAVPAHWEVQPIKRLLLSVEQGGSPQCENYPAESGQWGVLKVGCVNGGRFNADENKALPADLEPLPELGIRRGDVLVSRANTRELVGSVAVADRDYAHLLLCDKLYRLRVMPDRCEPSFLAHFIGSGAARSVIEAAATGASSSMLNIAQGAIVGMPMPLPPLDEQRALLRFLHAETAKIDLLIAEQQRLIALLTEKRQAVIAHAVTKGLNPLAPMKDAGDEWLGEVPVHWRVVPVKYLAEVGNGSTPHRDRADYWTGGDYPWLSSTVVNGEVVLEAEEFVTELALTECHLPKVRPPAVLIGITLILVIAAVILMGFALSWLLLVDLGTDPCTLLNQTISTRLGISIGNWQALFNTVLLIFVIIFGGRNLGFGTLANMFLVGYSIDFFSWIWAKVLPADLFTSMGVRIAVLIPALVLFILAASFYMDVDMGTAPYDAVSFIISTHLPNVSFRVIRIVYDFVVTAIAVLLGGKLGIVTVLMIITLGPVIEWLGNIMKQHLNIFDD